MPLYPISEENWPIYYRYCVICGSEEGLIWIGGRSGFECADCHSRIKELFKVSLYEIGKAMVHLQEISYEISCNHGFWDYETLHGGQQAPGNRTLLVASKIALIASEAMEGLEAWRCGNGPDDHLPHLSGLEAELADIVIRCADLAQFLGFDLGAAIIDKTKYNKDRPVKHGGKKF